jgi:hypothetical protein
VLIPTNSIKQLVLTMETDCVLCGVGISFLFFYLFMLLKTEHQASSQIDLPFVTAVSKYLNYVTFSNGFWEFMYYAFCKK